MKMHLLMRGLRRGSDFAQTIGVDEPRNLNDFLNKVYTCIRYEEKNYVVEVQKSRKGYDPKVESSKRNNQ
jgi:hypothetical protein